MDRLQIARVLLAFLPAYAACAHAQAPGERERAQLRQMQQQLQKLQQDNAALAKERGALDGKAKEAEQAKSELAKVRAAISTGRKEADRLREEVTASNNALSSARAEIARLQDEVKKRDDALQAAAVTLQAQQQKQQAVLDHERKVLGERLKQHAGRADTCESRYEQTVAFADQLLGRYEANRLRACEPITGLWRVREETQVQALRDRLEALRPGAPAQASAPGADGTATK